jgi:hypothetical protein
MLIPLPEAAGVRHADKRARPRNSVTSSSSACCKISRTPNRPNPLKRIGVVLDAGQHIIELAEAARSGYLAMRAYLHQLRLVRSKRRLRPPSFPPGLGTALSRVPRLSAV